MANLGNSTGNGRQTFHNNGNKFSVGNKTYETRATVKCCNSFQCLQVDSEFDPIRMASPLTVNGFGGLSRDELVSKDSGIPVMGGVAGGKKAVTSGIPVMGGVTGIKKSGSSGKLIVEKMSRGRSWTAQLATPRSALRV